MSQTLSESMTTIRTEAPDAGPTSIIAGVVCWVFAAAIAVGGIAWFGYSEVVDINSGKDTTDATTRS
jgi:hypothetical protein